MKGKGEEPRCELLRPEDREEALALLRRYLDWVGLDLAFQNIEAELEAFPGDYGGPTGRFLVAKLEGRIVGCVGLRRLDEGLCEMKRLYVEESCGGRGIGRALVERLIEEARSMGYRRMRLDTLEKMGKAQELYRSLGFREIPAYRYNPLPGSLYFEKELDPTDDKGGAAA